MSSAGSPEAVGGGAEAAVAPTEWVHADMPTDGHGAAPNDGGAEAEAGVGAELVGASRFAGRLLVGILVVLVGVAAISHSLFRSSPALTSTAAMETGAAAVNLAAGEGLRTSVAYPAALGFGQDLLKAPYLSAGPFFPALLAGYYGIRGDNDLAVRLCAALGVLVSAGVGLYLAMRLVGPAGAAVVAVVAMTSPVALDTALTNGPFAWAMAWFTLSAALVVDVRLPAPDTERRWWVVAWPWVRLGLAGACMGLCYLSLPSTLPLAVLLAAMVGAASPSEHRRAMLLAFAVPCAVCVFGWLARNLIVAHSPFLDWARLAAVTNEQGVPVSRFAERPESVAVFLLRYIKLHTWPIVSGNLASVATVAVNSLGVLLPFAVGAYLVRADRPADRRLRALCVWAPLVMLAWGLFWSRGAESAAIAAPLAAVLAVGLLVPYLARLRPAVRAVAWCFVALLAVGPVAGRTVGTEAPLPSALVQALAQTRGKYPKDLVLITDRPSEVAWFARYTAVYLPADQASLNKVLAALADHPVGYFFDADTVRASSRRDLLPYKDLLAGTALPEGLVAVQLPSPVGLLVLPNNVASESEPAPGPSGE